MRTIRNTRFRNFRNRSKGLVLAVQVVAIWYIVIFIGSYLTSDTGAYFNDVEKIDSTITTADDFCKEKGSDYWKNYCKDNAGLGNNPEPIDQNTGQHTDPDNPGHNKGGCDDHTNAPCTDGTKTNETTSGSTIDRDQNVTDLKGSRNGNSQNIDLSWKSPAGISYVKIYIDGNSIPIEDNVKSENIKLGSPGEVTYRVTTVDSAGNESAGVTVTVK